MGKNCLHYVYSLWAVLCKVPVFAHFMYSCFVTLGKTLARFTVLPQLIHCPRVSQHPWGESAFYTLSTWPTITTIFIYNKEQLRVAKEIV